MDVPQAGTRDTPNESTFPSGGTPNVSTFPKEPLPQPPPQVDIDYFSPKWEKDHRSYLTICVHHTHFCPFPPKVT